MLVPLAARWRHTSMLVPLNAVTAGLHYIKININVLYEYQMCLGYLYYNYEYKICLGYLYYINIKYVWVTCIIYKPKRKSQ